MINNTFYNELHEKWYEAFDHPVALLRAENISRLPWTMGCLKKHFATSCRILDVGCGAGFLTNELAKADYSVTGIDLSKESLEIAEKRDRTKKVRYLLQNAEALSFKEKFDAVFAMDILEHVENPNKVIEQASQVLKPGGLFFFHTFNRTWLSYLFAVKGVEWFVKNSPKNLHVYRLFIKPREIKNMCLQNALEVADLQGFSPKLGTAFFKLLFTRVVPENFCFKFTSSLRSGYTGYAIKK